MKVADRRCHAFAAEPVERPYEKEVELAPRRIVEQLGEHLAVLDTLAAILMLDVLAHDQVAHTLAPCAELPELFLGILPLVVGRDAGIDRNQYSHMTFLMCLSEAANITALISV